MGNIYEKFDKYGLRHLPSHLTQAEWWENLNGLLRDLRFISAKCAAELTYDLVEDYRAALDSLEGLEITVGHRESVLSQNNSQGQKDDMINSLKSFSRFVVSQSHTLNKFCKQTGFCQQLAYNYTNSGPIAKISEEKIGSERKAPMILHYPSRRDNHETNSANVRILEGHIGNVYDVDLASDACTAISAGLDRTVRVWSLNSGECIGVLKGHGDIVNSVSVTIDGRKAISGASDSTVRVWDLEQMSCISVLKGHNRQVNSVSLTSDGKKAISGSLDKTLRIWDLEKMECIETLKGHHGGISSVIMTPDGKKAVFIVSKSKIYFWDLENMKRLRYRMGLNRSRIVSITSDGKHALYGDYNERTLVLWHIETGVFTKIPGAGLMEGVHITPDGKKAISGGFDKVIRVWDIEKRTCVASFTGHSDSVYAVKISPDGKSAVSASWDGTIMQWDLEQEEGPVKEKRHSNWVHNILLADNGKRVISVSMDSTFYGWDFQNGDFLEPIKSNEGLTFGIAITPDGKRMVAGFDPILEIRELETGICLRTMEKHTKRIYGLDLTPDGRAAISGGLGEVVLVWDLKNGKCLKTCKIHNRILQNIHVSPDGKTMATDGWDHDLRIWDLESGKCLKTFQGHTSWICKAMFSPDGRKIVSGSNDQTLRIWNVETGECTGLLTGHTGRVYRVRISPDGSKIVSGGHDRTLRIWDIDSQECIAIYQAKSEITGLSEIKADGRFAYGAATGDVIFLSLKNIPMGPPIVTPVRIYRWEDNRNNGEWDSEITALCPWCYRRFLVTARILGQIRAIDSSILSWQNQTGRQGQLRNKNGPLSQCPLCGNKLRFNPFIVDNRDLYKKIFQKGDLPEPDKPEPKRDTK